MPRPVINFWGGQLFRRQLNAVLDWLESNSGGGGGGGPVAWDDVTDKPSTFAPATHSHPKSDVTGLETDLATLASDIAAAQGDVTDLATTIVCPATTSVIWRITAGFYVAP